MIKLPAQKGNNQVFPAIADADGNELCVCTSEQTREDLLNLLNPGPEKKEVGKVSDGSRWTDERLLWVWDFDKGLLRAVVSPVFEITINPRYNTKTDESFFDIESRSLKPHPNAAIDERHTLQEAIVYANMLARQHRQAHPKE